MKKVAIVGVEGSGKTVMLAGLGELYSHPDEHGMFLSPKNFETASYVADKIQRMRNGEWPTATAGDEMQGLDWVLRRKTQGQRPTDVCEVSFLDFAGEVYRTAFGVRNAGGDEGLEGESESLKKYIREADELIVLINLHDVVTKGREDPRVEESMWITNEILSYALDEVEGHKPARAAIVISQADSYKDTIESCGGAAGVLKKYLPHVSNNYDWLDIFAVSAVDKSVLDDSGNIVPAPDFQPTGLKPIMEWVCNERPGKPVVASKEVEKRKEKHIETPLPSQTVDGGFFSALAKPTDYRGRASRREYWHFLIGAVVLIIGGIIGLAWMADASQSASDDWLVAVGIILAVAACYPLIPLLPLQVRRAHDIGLSGWWLLLVIPLSCVYGAGLIIALLVLGLVPGRRAPNKYGAPIAN